MERSIRVLCVDDNADLAEVYASVIDNEDDMQSVGTLGSADALCETVRAKGANVVLMDLTMPGKSAMEAIEEMSRVIPACRMIAISGFDDPRTVDEAIERGAWGFVSKHGDMDALIKAIRAVAGGTVYLER